MDAVDVLAVDAGATQALGAAVAGVLEPGDIVSLTGELGAGKTTFVQGAALALGVTVPVVSPTFTLIREYPAAGAITVYHVDVYRLERIQDVIDLGFEEMTDAGGITFVEWGDAISALLSDDFLEIELRTTETDERRIRIAGHGRKWIGRMELLEAAVRSTAA
jgi:tRNA threonylcarbamoyladenosine biosynthesis protein TsaE